MYEPINSWGLNILAHMQHAIREAFDAYPCLYIKAGLRNDVCCAPNQKCAACAARDSLAQAHHDLLDLAEREARAKDS